jgi:hypothetical protein
VRDSVAFSSLTARSLNFVVGVSIVLVVESLALHALLLKRWPLLSLVLAVLNAWTIWWLARDYRAVATEPTLVRKSDLYLRLGRRIRGVVPLTDVREVIRPTWQQIPSVATGDYIKMSGADDPNVLVKVANRVTFEGAFGIRRQGMVIGLRLDDPDGFTKLVNERLVTSRI